MRKSFIIFSAFACVIVVGVVFFFIHTSQKEVRESPVTVAAYVCEKGTSLHVSFFTDTEKVVPQEANGVPTPTGKIELQVGSTTPFTLQQTLSADGGRYTNTDESIVFWDKGNGALFKSQGEKELEQCIHVPADPGGLSQMYADPTAFAIRFPDNYFIPFRDDKGLYDMISSSTDVQINVPASLAKETNLSSDSHISVEHMTTSNECTAGLFLQEGAVVKTVIEGDMEYSRGELQDAAAGNRYHEIVYAYPGTNPCRAIRYFIHYGVFENYPAGSIQKFNETELITVFDKIRKTLIVS